QTRERNLERSSCQKPPFSLPRLRGQLKLLPRLKATVNLRRISALSTRIAANREIFPACNSIRDRARPRLGSISVKYLKIVIYHASIAASGAARAQPRDRRRHRSHRDRYPPDRGSP